MNTEPIHMIEEEYTGERYPLFCSRAAVFDFCAKLFKVLGYRHEEHPKHTPEPQFCKTVMSPAHVSAI